MFDIDKTIDKLRVLFEKEREGNERRNQDYNKLAAIEIQDKFDALTRSMLREVLQDLLRYPPYHARHAAMLSGFYGQDSYERCVFIMSKYPDDKDPESPRLRKVIEIVRKSVESCGYSPRVASDKKYHPQLWDNVELCLIGCSRGIAVFEDKYQPELNPNVALEAGWMRGMGKDVLYLTENDFSHRRADWEGFLESKFCWNSPQKDIKVGIRSWLSGEK
jgi:hypothetical protein